MIPVVVGSSPISHPILALRHMSSLVRTLLIWLVVLALPVQGAAAATMAFCGPGHHGGESAGAELSVAAAQHSHHGNELARHDLVADAMAEIGSTDDRSAVAKVSQVTTHKCSACASCCSMGAFLTKLPLVAAADPAPTVFSTVAPPVCAVAADGPDRPPRNVRA